MLVVFPLIAHLHMRIVKIQRVVQSARILPIHVKEGDIRGKSASFYILVSGRPRSRELRDLVSFQLDKTGPRSLMVQGSPQEKKSSGCSLKNINLARASSLTLTLLHKICSMCVCPLSNIWHVLS